MNRTIALFALSCASIAASSAQSLETTYFLNVHGNGFHLRGNFDIGEITDPVTATDSSSFVEVKLPLACNAVGSLSSGSVRVMVLHREGQQEGTFTHAKPDFDSVPGSVEAGTLIRIQALTPGTKIYGIRCGESGRVEVKGAVAVNCHTDNFLVFKKTSCD